MVSADRICGFHGLRRGLFFVCRIRDTPVGVLSLEKEPLLLRVAALTRHLPGQPRRVEPTEAIKAGYCWHIGQLLLAAPLKYVLIELRALVMSPSEAEHVLCPASPRFARYSSPWTVGP